MMSSQSIVSSSRTVRPCNPMGGRWSGHWKKIWSTVWSSAPHPQAAEAGIPQMCKQEWKSPTPVRRLFSRTYAVLGRAIPAGWIGIKVRMCSTAFPISDLPRAPHFCYRRQMNLWVQMGVSVWDALQIPTRWKGERWVEQMSSLHGTAC